MRPEDKKYFEALSERDLMGLNIKMEAQGEPKEGRIAVGTVTLERVDRQGWMGKTIHEVILKPWQFSWTMEQAGADYYQQGVRIVKDFKSAYDADIVLRGCVDIAQGLMDGTIPRDPDLHAANCCQYLNPKVAGATKKKWLKGGMTLIKTIKHHEFFDDRKAK